MDLAPILDLQTAAAISLSAQLRGRGRGCRWGDEEEDAEADDEDHGDGGINWVGERCHQCGGVGHYARECPSAAKGKGKGKGGKGKGAGYKGNSSKGGGKGDKGKGKGRTKLSVPGSEHAGRAEEATLLGNVRTQDQQKEQRRARER